MRTVRTWTNSTNEWYHRMTRILLIQTIGSVTDLDRDMSEEEDFVDSDAGSIADLDRDMSDEEDCCDLDVGSMADLEWDTWADACTLAFHGAVGAVGAFPPEVAEIRPAVSRGGVYQCRCFGARGCPYVTSATSATSVTSYG